MSRVKRGAHPGPIGKGVLAVDGGASRTRGVLLCDHAVVLGFLPLGTNVNDIGLEEFEARFRKLVTPMFEVLEKIPESLRAGVALAGLKHVSLKNRIAKTIHNVLAGMVADTQITVLSDIEVLTRMLLVKNGVVLIAGTGSVCVARGPSRDSRLTEGGMVKVGGWGGLLDRGCGLKMGMGVLQEAARIIDCGSELGPVFEMACEQLGIGPQELPGLLQSHGREAVTELGEIVCLASRAGDPFSRNLLSTVAEDLSEMVCCAWERAGLTGSKPVYVTGGLLTDDHLLAMLDERLSKRLPQARLIPMRRPIVSLVLELLKRGRIESTSRTTLLGC